MKLTGNTILITGGPAASDRGSPGLTAPIQLSRVAPKFMLGQLGKSARSMQPVGVQS